MDSVWMSCFATALPWSHHHLIQRGWSVSHNKNNENACQKKSIGGKKINHTAPLHADRRAKGEDG
jgi:hypothetical protein